MMSRLALYHRIRRFQVIGFAYPIGLVLVTMAAGVLIWAIATPG